VKAGLAFEDEVRRVAEGVWGLEPGTCQPKSYTVANLYEVDAVVPLRDITHVVMATLETKLGKIKTDVDKLVLAEREEAKRGVPVKKWLVTDKQLNAEHITYARAKSVEVLTLRAFRARYFNASDYLRLRRSAAFGSARDPRTLSVTISDNEFIEPEMVGTSTRPGQRHNQDTIVSLSNLLDRISRGETIVLLGPFGVGKSLTTREVFLRLAGSYFANNDDEPRAPIAVNLREQWGMRVGQEVLERHARDLGFKPAEDLTGAWRSGMTHILMDGFDELAAQVIARPSDRAFMRNARFEALAPVRDLVCNSPEGTGILICGRDHYFDDLPELIDGLGLNGRPFVSVRLQDFTEAQAETYVERHLGGQPIPEWLPRKPLLLGYVTANNLLADLLAIDAFQGFGYVWGQFLDLICAREAEHGKSIMDPQTIRRVLERLASVARATSSGTGPLTGPDLADAYRAETGNPPGEGVIMQLQRLPGLTPRDQDPTARSFVDIDLLAALQGSAVARAVRDNATEIAERRWLTGLTTNGVRMASFDLGVNGYDSKAVLAVASRWARGSTARPWEAQLAADAFLVALDLSEAQLDGEGLTLREAQFETIDLEERACDTVVIEDSAIRELLLDEAGAGPNTRFVRCYIGRLLGVSDAEALPKGLLVNCEVRAFDDASTNAAVLRLDIPPQIKALMTVLRKLFLQAGGGRKMSALRRGIPDELLPQVNRAVAELKTAGIVEVRGEVVNPVRRYAPRARTMLAKGVTSDDVVVARLLH
jgi:hypothetical protein